MYILIDTKTSENLLKLYKFVIIRLFYYDEIFSVNI